MIGLVIKAMAWFHSIRSWCSATGDMDPGSITTLHLRPSVAFSRSLWVICLHISEICWAATGNPAAYGSAFLRIHLLRDILSTARRIISSTISPKNFATEDRSNDSWTCERTSMIFA